jgi:ATP-binding cassette subfamily B protein
MTRRERRGRHADALPELQPFAGHDRAEHMLRTGFWAMAARLPRMVGRAASLSWHAQRGDTALAVAVSLAAGVLTAGGILATRDVLRTLIGHPLTTARLDAALPGLAILASTVGLRAALSITSSWCQARLKPRVRQLVGTRFLEVATSVELARFDDPAFMDDMERARDRGAE